MVSRWRQDIFDMKNEEIHHVSDTALWIAAYRALESERPDAVFKDDLARKLAGERGFTMVAQTPNTESMAFAMVTRTTAIDRLVHHAIMKGATTVINLGAGLDTRPYRLKLPPTLSWIEVDFPNIIAYKNARLKDEAPVCKLQRLASDLSNDSGRKALFAELGRETNHAVVITEGVVAYLRNEQAANLSRDLYDTKSFQHWIMDYSQGKHRNNGFRKKLDKGVLANAPLQFDNDDPVTFFGRQGWEIEDNIFILDEADRLGRKLPATFPLNIAMKVFPKTVREAGNKTYGYVMFRRSD
jgi:methyltransferase (TIGR00027 family)